MPNSFAELSRWLPGWLGGQRSRADHATAIYLSGSGVALATGTMKDDRVCYAMRSDPLRSLAESRGKLQSQFETLDVHQLGAHIVLAPELYSLSLMERPAVADEEVLDAVRWQMQENVDFPMEQASLDYFPLPQAASRGRDMVFVAAVRTDVLKSIIDDVYDVGLEAASVDISELALRNVVFEMFPGMDQSIVLLRATSNSAMINISRGEEIFLSRRMMGLPGHFSAKDWEEYKDRFLLQVQRSMDYYESSMGQAACSAVLVATTHGWQQHLVEYLAEMLPIPIRTLTEDLAQDHDLCLYNPEPVDVDWGDLSLDQSNAIAAALPAMGGLLRGLDAIERLAAA